MTAPNIEMIAESLRNCSLSGRSRGARSPAVRSPPPQQRRGEESAEVTVELNSEVALPYHWEQCLDMRTGQVYYRNWTTGRRTTEDPRLAVAAAAAAAADGYYSSSSDDDSSDDDEDSSDEGSRDNYFGEFSTGDSSSSSAYSPEVTSADPQVLVAAGCKSCFMYFMVPKQDFACPKCGRLLLHLGRSSSSGGGSGF